MQIGNDTLEQIKNKLGPVVHTRFEAKSYEQVFEQIGEQLRERIGVIAQETLETLKATDLLEKKVAWANQSLHWVHSTNNILPNYRNHIDNYISSLHAWSKAAGLKQMAAKYNISGTMNIPAELLVGYMLQDDNVGCQTAMVPIATNLVLLFHSEEDTGTRVDKPRIFTLKVPGKEISYFVYPSLLPGSSFAYARTNDDFYLQTVDFLYIRREDQHLSLANMAVFATLLESDQNRNQEIISTLRPYVDGYALNCVMRKETGGEREISGENIVFANNALSARALSRESLLQVNILNSTSAELMEQEMINREDKQIYEQRLLRLKNETDKILGSSSSAEDTLKALLTAATSQEGGDYALANRDVKATAVIALSKSQIYGLIHPGPVMLQETSALHSNTLQQFAQAFGGYFIN